MPEHRHEFSPQFKAEAIGPLTLCNSQRFRGPLSPRMPVHDRMTARARDRGAVTGVAYGIQPLLDRGIAGRGVTVLLPEDLSLSRAGCRCLPWPRACRGHPGWRAGAGRAG